MKRSKFERIVISSILFIACLVLLWMYVEVLPIWLTDPYTYSAYNKAKQLAADLDKALTLYSKNYGMANNFSDFTTIYDTEKKENSYMYSFEPLRVRGVEVGTVEKDTLKFNNRDLDGEEIEVHWVCQNVTATYKLRGNTVSTHIRAIFNMGEVIEQDIINDPGFLF
ncbi:MAG: hypothetical protein V1747_06930 [Candidatus Omnitrophota bacterium]